MGNVLLTDKEVKEVELGILDYLDKVCVENDIQYFLDYGTLLGAIRHKGFIPWDDDIDVCMTRENYIKLCNFFKENETSEYRLLTCDNDIDFPYEIGKLVDSRTKLIETDIHSSENMGIWVDIFPKDNIPKNHKLLRGVLFVSFVLRILAVYEKFPHHKSKILYPVWFLSRIFGYRFFLSINQALIRFSGRFKSSKYIGNIRDFVSKVYYWEKSFFDCTEYVEFEGRLLPAPKRWDEYLRGLYGDYMVLPPEDKRKKHQFNAFWR